MRRAKQWRTVLALSAVAAGILTAAPAATAAVRPEAGAPDMVAALRANPGSHQVDATTIELEPGVRMSLPSAGRAAGGLHGCPDLNVCLYQNGNFGGAMLRFWRCQDIRLENYDLPDGRDWRDKTSSFVNNQTGNAVARLRDTKPDGTFHTLSSTAVQTVADLVNVRHPGGGNWNEKIDRLQVC
jgi:hypothetical protein